MQRTSSGWVFLYSWREGLKQCGRGRAACNCWWLGSSSSVPNAMPTSTPSRTSQPANQSARGDHQRHAEIVRPLVRTRRARASFFYVARWGQPGSDGLFLVHDANLPSGIDAHLTQGVAASPFHKQFHAVSLNVLGVASRVQGGYHVSVSHRYTLHRRSPTSSIESRYA